MCSWLISWIGYHFVYRLPGRRAEFLSLEIILYPRPLRRLSRRTNDDAPINVMQWRIKGKNQGFHDSFSVSLLRNQTFLNLYVLNAPVRFIKNSLKPGNHQFKQRLITFRVREKCHITREIYLFNLNSVHKIRAVFTHV